MGKTVRCAFGTPALPFMQIVAPVRAEPRAWLANERTFLSWMQAASTLVVISSGITTAADSPPVRLVGLLLAAPGVLFVLHATVYYYLRRHQLDKRSVSSYYNQSGPFVLCLLMTIVIAMNVVLSLWRAAHVQVDTFNFATHKFTEP